MTSRTVAPPAELDTETEEEKKKEKKAQAALLVEVAEEMGLEFFHDPDGEAFARAPAGGTWAVGSKAFKRWLGGAFYHSAGGVVPRKAALDDALAIMEARAIHDGPEMPVFIRVGRLDEAVYVDLGDPTWRVIEVSGKGWRLLDGAHAPVRFRRPQGMLPLPEPERGGRLGEMREHLNLADEEAWSLVAGYLVASLALAPRGPYPILAFRGEQGSAKSSATENCGSLIDPRTAGLRSLPHSLENLAVAAHNGHLLAFDNVSHIEPWLSDGLCRLATGAGFATRALYTNSEEALFDAARPLILNGIESAAVRGDLVDRLVSVELPTIAKERRIAKRVASERFEAARPRILAGLLDAVVLALRERDAVKLADLPRMADFTIVAVAAEPAMGVAPGTFLRAYGAAQHEGAETVAGADAVADAVLEFIQMKGPWEGSASELLKALPPPSNPRGWPRDATRMAGRLSRIAPTLRPLGLEVKQLPRTGRGRRWRISAASPGSGTAPSPGNANGNGQMTLVTPVTLSPPTLHTFSRPTPPEEIWTPAELAAARRAPEGEGEA